MNKIKHRAFSVLILILLLLAGLSWFLYQYTTKGASWASFSANQNAYQNGQLIRGSITDRSGRLLLQLDENGYHYSESEEIRKSTLHAVGDPYGNIGTGAVQIFKDSLTGYNLVSGLYDTDGGTVVLSLDAELNSAAYEALEGRKGVVAIADCNSGELLAMVSTPTYDPNNPPESIDSTEYEGAYLNRFLSAAYTPGSIYKLITTAAALETVPNFTEKAYLCEGSMVLGSDTISCMGTHGSLSAKDALAVSCNCAFAQIALDVGSETLAEYVTACSLAQGIRINDIKCADGLFQQTATDSNLAWSGIGQYTDLICPASMLRFVAAIANHGMAPEFTLLKSDYESEKTQILKSSTADTLREWMGNNVTTVYGTERFPNITVYAKSGTAEQGSGILPHAWFVGFAEKDGRTLAFLVLVENGGYGSSVAGNVAASVLAKAFSD